MKDMGAKCKRLSQHAQSKSGLDSSVQPPPPAQLNEYDPCALAKPCSPFYLYNHDSPRPSTDHKSKKSVQVSVQDLELGDPSLSPSVSQEKLDLQLKTRQKSRFMFWQKECKLRTMPKQKGRIARLPKKQRLLVKFAIAFLIVGCMIGIAVGIAAGLKSGVWKSENQVRPINI